ncbi:MAG: alpha-hydroxy acid oxidase [Geminicoccaceae bacterium]
MSERAIRGLTSVAAFRAKARSILPRAVFDFADGAAEDERTLRRNEAAFGDIELLPRPLEGAGQRDLSVELFGKRLSMPLLVGPTGLAGLFWPEGELATARAAAAAGTVYCLSHGSTCTLEALAATGVGPRWMQVFVYTDRGLTHSMTERAAAAGYDALVLTIDNQMLGNRERDVRNGFSIPPRITGRTALGMALRVPWLWRMREHRNVTFANYAGAEGGDDIRTLSSRMAQLLDPSASWADVAVLRKLWSGPLLLKGILHPDEARRAVAEGVDGVIVSNHGGRQLDGAAPSIEAAPAVVEAVEGRIPVLLDGGVRRGVDIAKARALGVTACLIGRPHLWGLSVGGEAGVRAVLELYRRELDRVMALCGWASLADISPRDLHRGVAAHRA